MDCEPGSAAFALVAWKEMHRDGRWSFWKRGTGERMLQHHCKGTKAHSPVDADRSGSIIKRNCRDCGAAPRSDIVKIYLSKSW